MRTTLSVKVTTSLKARVERLARARKTSVSAVVRDALERYLSPEQASFAEAARDFIGSLDGGPGDLATSRKLKGFGR
jgi:predicted transcriptional regulator